MKKKLGPPRGADATRAATLASRFHENDEVQPLTEPETATKLEPALRPPARRSQSRGEPAGMTRRTLYLPTTVADALFGAADDIAAAFPLATRHQILAALLQHGLDHVNAARTAVRQQLLDSLTPE